MIVLLSACGPGSATPSTPGGTTPDTCADVIGVDTDQAEDGTFAFSVTVRSDDIGWDGYADRWEVVSEGVVVASRELSHPHVDEQPFTRSLSGIALGPGDVVEVRSHHSVGGYCGAELSVAVVRSG